MIYINFRDIRILGETAPSVWGLTALTYQMQPVQNFSHGHDPLDGIVEVEVLLAAFLAADLLVEGFLPLQALVMFHLGKRQNAGRAFSE